MPFIHSHTHTHTHSHTHTHTLSHTHTHTHSHTQVLRLFEVEYPYRLLVNPVDTCIDALVLR